MQDQALSLGEHLDLVQGQAHRLGEHQLDNQEGFHFYQKMVDLQVELVFVVEQMCQTKIHVQYLTDSSLMLQ